MPATLSAFKALLWLVALTVLSGCTTSGVMQQAHWQFLSGDTAAAVSTLGGSDQVARKDRLLYWLEKGMYLHYAGDYERSSQELLKAAEYIQQSDYISLTSEARELLANEWASSYRGEYSEQLWVHSILMMNFLHMGRYDSAAVEARRALEVMDSRTEVLKPDYFTRALIALSFEAAQQANDAYIVNRKLADDSKTNALDAVLFKQASTLGFASDAVELKKRSNNAELNTSSNVAVLFIAAGQVPQKFSGSLITSDVTRLAFPQYAFAESRPEPLSVLVNGNPCNCSAISSDLGELVSASLNKRGVSLATKSLIRAAAKDAVADAAADADEIVGELTRLLLFALEEADTRSWRSLPRHFTMIRVPLPSSDTIQTLQISRGTQTQTLTIEPGNQGLQFFSLLPQQFVN